MTPWMNSIPFCISPQEEYRNSMPASSFQQQKLRVCEVCSAYLGLHDNDRRLADHFGGKLHLGFIQIREKLDQLKVCPCLSHVHHKHITITIVNEFQLHLAEISPLILHFWSENRGWQAGEKKPGAFKKTRREGERGKDEKEVSAGFLTFMLHNLIKCVTIKLMVLAFFFFF